MGRASTEPNRVRDKKERAASRQPSRSGPSRSLLFVAAVDALVAVLLQAAVIRMLHGALVRGVRVLMVMAASVISIVRLRLLLLVGHIRISRDLRRAAVSVSITYDRVVGSWPNRTTA